MPKLTVWTIAGPDANVVISFGRRSDISRGISKARNGEPSAWVKREATEQHER